MFAKSTSQVFDSLLRKLSTSALSSFSFTSEGASSTNVDGVAPPTPPEEPVGQSDEEVMNLFSCYHLYVDTKKYSKNHLEAVQAVLKLTNEDCYDQGIVRKKYEIWKNEYNVEKFKNPAHREHAQYLMSKVNVEYQMLLTRYKRFHMIPMQMEEIFAFSKKIKSLRREVTEELSDVHEDATFKKSPVDVTSLWTRIHESEHTTQSLRLEFTVCANPILETFKIKAKEVPLKERDLKYYEMIPALFKTLEEITSRVQEAKQLFKKREQKIQEKFDCLLKNTIECVASYKNTGLVLGKNLYKKDQQRFSSINVVQARVQLLAGINNNMMSITSNHDVQLTLFDQYNEFRTFLQAERDTTYQKHLEGGTFIFSFFKKFGLITSCLVEIYDEILANHPRLELDDYVMFGGDSSFQS